MALAGAARLATAAMRFGFAPLLLLLLLVAPVAICHGSAGAGGGFRAALIRTAESRNFSLAAERSRRRLSMFTSGAGAQAPVQRNGADYVMQLGIGAPELVVWAEADTGSDLVWVKCSPCTGCDPIPSPLYDPSSSSSSSQLPCASQPCRALGERAKCTSSNECVYRYTYGYGDHYTQGVLGTENFTFAGGFVADGVAFGCSDTIYGSQFGRTSGLVGLGRGALSLVSQLDAGRFAYCLSVNPHAESPILFGSLAGLNPTAGDVFSTPLLNNTVKPARDTYYYVGLKGITVGETDLPIEEGTFAIDANGGGGVFFDSGTTLTLLADEAYRVVTQVFVSQMQARYDQVDGSRYQLDLCFQTGAGEPQTTLAVPQLVLHFDGADMKLKWYNYFRFFSDRVFCLEMASSQSVDASIIGNIMQTNFRILHDVDSMKLSFQAADCGP